MSETDLPERIRVDRDTNQIFPVGPDDLELELQIYDPDFDEFIQLGRPVLVDADCKETQGTFAGLADIGKLMYEELKFVPSSRLLIASIVGAYDLMQDGDERARRFLDKFMKGGIVSERVATDGGPYGVVHHDDIGKGIYATECPPCGDFDKIWKGDVARTMQILTGLKDPDKLIEISRHYGQDKPVLMPPERPVRSVHVGYATPLSICFGYYPDGHSGLGRGMSMNRIVRKSDYSPRR